VVTYPILQAFFNEVKNKKKIEYEEFMSRARTPRSAEEKEKKYQKRLA
jgi:hypothetical protein